MKSPKDRPHVLHLVRWYPHKDDPMFGLFVQRHIRAASRYVRSTVIFVRPVPGLIQAKRSDCEVEGVREIRVDYPERSIRALNFLAFVRAVWSLSREVRRSDAFDCVHVHILTRLGILAWWQKRMHGTPYVITEHWSRYIDDRRYRGKLRKRWTRKVVANADALINVSKYLEAIMVGRGLIAKRMEVIPNVVDCDVFCIRPTQDYFVHVSCFQREAKNVMGLVEAMAVAGAEGYKPRLLMVGTGVMRNHCKALAEQRGLGNRVVFPGLLEGQALADCVAGAKAMVVFSDYETGPVVALEALAAGVPVISTRVGGVAEVVDNQNGILIPIRDATALIEAMKSVSQGVVSFDRHRIRSEACAKFGVDAIAERHRRLYSEILRPK